MPPLKTRCDSLREYLTGAASDGAVQIKPDASLGGHRSSTEALTYGIFLSNMLNGVTIDYASPGNAVGVGQLVLSEPNKVTWADNGGLPGSYLYLPTIGSNGIVEVRAKPGAYLRITRVGTISGDTAEVTLSVLYNNFFGFSNVPSADAVSGKNYFRASILRNEGTLPINLLKRYIGIIGTFQTSDVAQLGPSGGGTLQTSGTFADWPKSGYCKIRRNGLTLREMVYYSSRTNNTLVVTARGMFLTTAEAGTSSDTIYAVPGIAVGLDSAGVQTSGSAIQAIATPQSAPTGITWTDGIFATNSLSVSQLAPGQQIGMWMWRQVPLNCACTPMTPVPVVTTFYA